MPNAQMIEETIQVARATIPCKACGAQVTETRRGRCWGCYTRWSELRPIGHGAACTVCNERRLDCLRLVELHSRSVPLCHTCAGRTARLASVPASIDALRTALDRNRRRRDRRARTDHRPFLREHRVGERRTEIELGAADLEPIDEAE